MLVSRTAWKRGQEPIVRSTLWAIWLLVPDSFSQPRVSTGLQDQSRLQSSQPSRTAAGCFQPCRRLRPERITTAKLAKPTVISAHTYTSSRLSRLRMVSTQIRFRKRNSREFTELGLVSGDGKAVPSRLFYRLKRKSPGQGSSSTSVGWNGKRASHRCGCR